MTPQPLRPEIKWKLFFLMAMATMTFGCSPEKQLSTPDNLIWAWSTRFNEGHMVLQKVADIAYNPADNSAIIALEPAPPGQSNLLKVSYDPKKALKDQLKIDRTRITQGSLRLIRTSFGGKYTATAGRTRELVLLKDQQGIAKFDLADELTCMEFGGKNENILAVGDRKGRLTLIDLEQLVVLNTVQLFQGEITALAFYKEDQILASGNDSRIVQTNISTGNITRIIETHGLREDVLHATGLKHCHNERINQVLYVPSKDRIITAHGWDYCRDFRIAVWNASTGLLVKETKTAKYPVYHMVWVSQLETVVLADHDRNLWRLSLDDYSLSGPIHLPQTFARYGLPAKKELAATTFGNIQSLVSLPGTPLLLIGTGSYFKAGSGVLLTELTSDAIKNIAHLTIDIRGNAHLLVREDLFHKLRPPPT